MRLPVLAAALALLVTPALAQSDTSGATDAQPPAKHMTHAKKKHKKMTHAKAMPSTKCGPEVKTEQTEKAKPCT